jgi:hypothetical protein
MITRWIHELEQSVRVQGHRIGLKSKHKGTIGGTYISRINGRDPSYLTYLFCYASGILDHTATFQQLANAMNAKAVMEDVFPSMRLSTDQLKRWFRDMKGKELQKGTKPYLMVLHRLVKKERQILTSSAI